MILIFSNKEYEQGTDPVVDWLLYYKADFLKITIDDLIEGTAPLTIDILQQTVIYNGRNLIDKINVVWYRRLFKDQVLSESLTNSMQPLHKTAIQKEIKQELEVIFNYFFYLLKNKKWLPHYNHIRQNKLDMLIAAQNQKLKTPQTKIINNKKDLQVFHDSLEHGIITKPITNTFYYTKDFETYLAYTQKVGNKQIQQLSDYFFPSLFQERIIATVELRVFYLDGLFLTQAILPIDDLQDRDIDIKQNRKKNKVEHLYYQLSKAEEKQLDSFMKELNLTIGSIDVLVTEKQELVILEVNPGGQYLFESQQCNFYLEKLIAEWLIKNDN